MTQTHIARKHSVTDLHPEQQLEILSEAINMSTALVFVTDGVPPSRGGPHITWANRAFLEEMGYELDEILGSTPAIFYGPETDRDVAKRLRDTIESGKDGSAEYIVYRKDGSPVWVDFSGRLIRSSIDKQERWIAVGRNIEKQHVAQHRLEDFSHALEVANERLREANKHRADLIAMLAHDVKSPITAIAGFAQILADPQSDDKDREVALITIQATAHRLARLASDTLTMSEVDRNEMSLTLSFFDISKLVDEIVQVHCRQREIAFTIKGTIQIQADRERLRQAIDNVLTNAIHYSSAPIAITLHATETHCTLAIQDRGIGVPRQELSTLFQRFTRASNAKTSGIKGSGLGLYLVKTIVERHGGTVEIQSTENIGTTVTLTLPISQSLKQTF